MDSYPPAQKKSGVRSFVVGDEMVPIGEGSFGGSEIKRVWVTNLACFLKRRGDRIPVVGRKKSSGLKSATGVL